MTVVPGEEPGVKVTQEFLTTAPIYEEPPLFPVFVGIARQLEVDVPDGAYDSSVGGANATAGVDFESSYPDFKLNSIYTTGTLTAKIQNSLGTFDFDPADVLEETPTAGDGLYTIAKGATVERTIASGTTGSWTSGSATFSDANARFITRQVIPYSGTYTPPILGEVSFRLRITSGTFTGVEFVITDVTSQNDLVLDVSVVGTPATFPGLFDESNVQYTVVSVEYAVGTVLISYEADRSDLNDQLVTIGSFDDIEAELGPISPDNPLAFAVSLAAANTSKQILATGVSANTRVEHQRALDFLETRELYAMVPLTQDTTILSLYQAHVNQASAPDAKHERRVYINRELLIQETRISTADARVGGYTTGTKLWVDGTPGTLDFTDYVEPGDFVVTTFSGVTYNLLVQTVAAGSLTISPAGSTPTPITITAGTAYTVVSAALSKTEQAQYIGDYAQGFSDKRVFLVWPDQVGVPVDGVVQNVPGYFLSAGIAGLVGEERPQQPLTNLSLAGYSSLEHSNLYFSEAQLRIMSANGVFIVVQDTSGTPPRIRQQRSTDISSLYKNEDSILRTVDYVAKFMRSELQPYIGRYNITPQYMDMIRVVVNGLFKRLQVQTEVGPTILAGRIVLLEQDSVELDHINLTVRIEVGVPANFIDVLLQV